MSRVSKAVIQSVALALALLVATLGLSACGDSGDDGAAEVARQQELRAARLEAAQDARQSAKIADLERRLNGTGSSSSRGGSTAEPADPEPPVATTAPLSGTWKGEATIGYDDGRSAPFMETVRIDALRTGQVAGYAEALQGSTTCHGPITYQGESEGWYRFSAEEQNVEECIDYSEVELRPSGSGLSYRETTDVSVSSGELERVP